LFKLDNKVSANAFHNPRKSTNLAVYLESWKALLLKVVVGVHFKKGIRTNHFLLSEVKWALHVGSWEFEHINMYLGTEEIL
jgi:hypothetical protein